MDFFDVLKCNDLSKKQAISSVLLHKYVMVASLLKFVTSLPDVSAQFSLIFRATLFGETFFF